MKQILTILFIAASFTTFAQATKQPPKIKDTVAAESIPINDSTLLISVSDLKPIYEKLQELPFKQAAPFIQYLNNLIGVRADEYRKAKASEINKSKRN